MHSIRTFTQALILAALSLSLLLSACGPAANQPAAVQPAAADPAVPAATATGLPPSPQPSNTPVPPTATAEPSLTPTSTATAEPSATPTPEPTFGVAPNGLSAWCLPQDAILSQSSDPASPPDYAIPGEMVDGALEVHDLPVLACYFIYTFNQLPPQELKLEVYELNQKAPWLTADLLPVQNKPGAAAALLRHTYIVEPPLWEVHYEFVVRDAQGTELRRDPVSLYRWTPELCWNGRYPNPITLRCPLPQDLHPWDPSYGTPIPTFPPKDD